MELIIAEFMIGFLGRFLEGPTREWFPPTDDGDDVANRLVSYMEGGSFIIIGFSILALALLPRKQAWQAISMLCASMVGVGAGVSCGFLMDRAIKR